MHCQIVQYNKKKKSLTKPMDFDYASYYPRIVPFHRVVFPL